MLPLTSRTLGIALIGIVDLCWFGPSQAGADDPVPGYGVVYEAQPRETVEHGVEWKGPFDSARRVFQLTGPVYYATSARLGRQPAIHEPLFHWYGIQDSDQLESPCITAWIEIDSSAHQFQLGPAAFFLSTAQRLTEGRPSAIPDGLGHFVAYRLVDAKQVNREISLATDSRYLDIRLQTPVFCCIPVEEWHHAEHFPVKDASSGWIVYQIKAARDVDQVTTLDQFGLHTLQLGPASWVGVPGRIVRVDKTDR